VTPELVEREAERLYDLSKSTLWGRIPWRYLTESLKNVWRDAARAVLEETEAPGE
jgi:hypothetical protein